MMTTSTLITPNPVTDGQKDSIVRIAEEAAKKAITILNLTNPSSQRVIMRGDELKAAIIAKVNELSFELPNLDCFAIDDWQTFYRIAFTPDQMAAVGNFPWSEATLNSSCPFHKGKMVRETHFAFVGVDSVTMTELQRLNPKATEPRFCSYADAWYAKEKFATKAPLGLRWYLLLRDIVPGSENKTFDEQQAMLPAKYEVPSAVTETAKDLLVFKKTGVYVNPTRYARTVDLDSGGYRVRVGFCRAGGVHVDSCWDSRLDGNVGVGASRKFDQEPCS
jgi:hypothetical protein